MCCWLKGVWPSRDTHQLTPSWCQLFLGFISKTSDVQNLLFDSIFFWFATLGWVKRKMAQVRGDLNHFIVITLYHQQPDGLWKLHFLYNPPEGTWLAFNTNSLSPTSQQNNTYKTEKIRFLKFTIIFFLLTRYLILWKHKNKRRGQFQNFLQTSFHCTQGPLKVCIL